MKLFLVQHVTLLCAPAQAGFSFLLSATGAEIQQLNLDREAADIGLEFKNGVLKKITGPVPMMVRVTAHDSCENIATVMSEFKPNSEHCLVPT